MYYDILNRYIIDVIPEKYRSNEIYMAKRHMRKDQIITENYNSIYIWIEIVYHMIFLHFCKKII